MSPWKMAVKTAGLISFVLIFAGAGQAGGVKGTVSVEGIKSAGDIAVYVDAIPGKTFDPPSEHPVINQQKMNFIPHVTVILQGTTVDFLNSDNVAHNVYWPSVGGNKKLAGNLGSWPQGQKKSFQFKDAGAAALLCNVHPEMSGYVVVVPTPYFAVTDKQGNYEIKNVPPGQYTIKTWSEDGKPVTQSVTVANDTVTTNLVVKK
jgi:plastocyanin